MVAVEPDERMRDLHETALAGSAEDIPAADASFDAVFVAEAFHWFDAQAAIAEIGRVLRPRGGLAIISMHWWETEPPLPEAALDVLREPYERFAPQRNPPWDPAFADSPFEPLRYYRLKEAVEIGADRLLELYSTTSSMAALPPEERAELLGRVRPLLEDAYRLPVKHELAWTRLA